MLGRWWRQIGFLWNRDQHDRDLAEEMESHRRLAGQERFGNTLRLREESRDAWGLVWVDRLRQDLRYAFRTLRKSPAFTVTALVVLTLGIGVNVVLFSLFDAFILRPLPVKDPHSLVRVTVRRPQSTSSGMPYARFEWYRQNQQAAANFFAASSAEVHFGPQANQRVHARYVTPDYFEELGAFPAYGRLLQGSADGPASEPVVVASHRFWQRELGADPGAIGRLVTINNKPVRLIGVTGSDFSDLRPESYDLWMPSTLHPYLNEGSEYLTSRTNSYVDVYVRLKPGMTSRATEDALRPTVQALAREEPAYVSADEWLELKPGAYLLELKPKGRPLVAFVFSLVLLVLIGACANLGNLLLARSAVRGREIAIRLTLGASRGRIIRQLLTECLLLAFTGATAALAVASVVARMILVRLNAPADVPLGIDWRIVLFTYGIATAAALAFGLTPALQATRKQVTPAIKEGTGQAAGSLTRTRLRSLLLTAQVAVSCVLLIVAGLLARGVQRVLTLDLGFDYRSAIAVAPGLAGNGYQPEAARQFWQDLQARVRALPGVEDAALASISPLGNANMRSSFPRLLPGAAIRANNVSGSLFSTLRVPVVRGRTFVASDSQPGSNSVIVSEAFARRAWPDKDPVGQTIERDDASPLVVVGVVGGARMTALSEFENLEIYYPPSASAWPHMTMLVRTAGNPGALVKPLTTAVQALDPRLLPTTALLRDRFSEQVKTSEQGALLVSLLGLLALALATIGIWGLMNFAVTQRTKEIGLRMALGADAGSVVRLLGRQLLKPVFAGLALGVAAAAGLSQLIKNLIFGLSNLDPFTYLAAMALLALVAVLSCLLPAVRALRVDPSTALRCD